MRRVRTQTGRRISRLGPATETKSDRSEFIVRPVSYKLIKRNVWRSIRTHASLSSSRSHVNTPLVELFVNNVSEDYTWLKSLPGRLGLEKCSRVFESRGFLTLSSLKYLRPGDIDAFFPSPKKLLLAEKRILESEIKGIVDLESRRTPLRPLELSQRFNSYSDTWENYYASSSSYQTAPSHHITLL